MAIKYRVLGFEKHPRAGTDFTKAVAGETVGILLEPVRKKAEFKVYVTYVLGDYILRGCKQGDIDDNS